MQHAFYCGRGFSIAEWTRALNAAEDVEWTIFGNSAQSSGIETAADLMASIMGREQTDPISYAFLKALGRRTGVAVAVNTSLNVGAPIAQSPAQVLGTLRRAKGMDGLFAFAEDSPVLLAWIRPRVNATRIREWLNAWQGEASAAAGLS